MQLTATREMQQEQTTRSVLSPAVQQRGNVSPFLPPLAVKKLALLRTLNGHKGSVWIIALSADGQTLVSGSSDSTIKVWGT